MLLRALGVLLLLCITTPALAGETVTYKDGDVTLEGYFVQESRLATNPLMIADGPQIPTVLIIHQWKGLGDHEKSRAEMIAKAGFNVFAIDMYGQNIRPQTPETAGAEAGKYKNNPALALRRMNAALDYIKTRPEVDADHIAVMGFCFGGTMALDLARSGAPIKSAISFHGGLSSKAPVTTPGAVKAALLIHHGADDPHVPPAEVQGFMTEMNTAQADWVLTQYAGAVHSFTEKEAGNDPSKGAAYNEKADHRSWAATLDFLAETLETPSATR
jgi:dienelactone hydrolase